MSGEPKPGILVIDDEIGPRESLKIILKPHYRVHTAADGAGALEVLNRHRIDVVTLDLKMPGLPGLQVLREIKGRDPTVEVIIITGIGSFTSAIEALRHGVFDFLSKPFNVFDVLSALRSAVERRRANLLFRKFLDAGGGNGGRPRDTAALRPALFTTRGGRSDEASQLEFVKVLACTLESRDPYTHGHSGRVTYYANLLGQKAGLTPAGLESLQISSFLHDIGKVGVPDAVICKEGRLTPEETKIMQQHPEKGVFIIECLDIPADIVDVIRHHHERYDGGGYPWGLRGEEIPYTARIVAIADAYDAMSSSRPYRTARSRETIEEEFRRCAGTQFDPGLTGFFLEILAEDRGGAAAPPLERAAERSTA